MCVCLCILNVDELRCRFHKPSHCVLLKIKNLLASCLSCISVLDWRNAVMKQLNIALHVGKVIWKGYKISCWIPSPYCLILK